MKGTITTMAVGGALSARRERRLMKLAIRVAGKWVEARKVFIKRKKRERCLEWSRSASSSE